MKKLAIVLLFASPLFAQVQIGKNVQIGGAGAGGTGCNAVGTSTVQISDGSGGCLTSPADYGIQGDGIWRFQPTGNFNIIGGANFNVSVDGNASFTPGGSFGVNAANGIGLTDTSTTGIGITTGGVLNVGSNGFTLTSTANVSMSASNAMTVTAGAGGLNVTAGTGGIGITSGGGIFVTTSNLGLANPANNGFGLFDTSALHSADSFTWTLPRLTGTLMLYTGSLTANDCVQVNATGDGFIDAGATCGTGGGGSAFNAITSGSNTTATMVCGSGCSLGVTGTGINAATSVGGITVTGTPSIGQVLTAISTSAANWQAAAGGSPAFSAITSATNTTAAMLCGAGCTLGPSSTGIVTASRLGTLGTTTTVLHGNASGNPTYGAVSLTADVTGALPNANLANPSTTVNSQTCTLGSTCTIPAITPSGTPTTGFFPIFTGSSAIGNSHLDDGATTAGTITATEPISISGTPSIFTGTTSPTPLAGKITLAAGIGHFTFPVAFTSAPYCTASDATAIAAVQVVSSTTQVAVSGTGTDVVNYLCIGSVQ